MSKVDLKVDWATHEAAKHAVLRWHYSRAMPVNKLVKIGAWENGEFVGVVIFGTGSGNATNGKPYGLARSGEVAELVRVAFRDHVTPISKIVKIALAMLKKRCPGIRVVVSYADPDQGHHGGIYQAGNWVHTGSSSNQPFFRIYGEKWHPRSVSARGWKQQLEWLQKHVDKKAGLIDVPPKIRYVMPMDKEMRKRIAPLAKPYPTKFACEAGDGEGTPSNSGGATPTHTLQTA